MSDCVIGKYIGNDGYARVCAGHARWVPAHRAAWEAEHGRIPEGMHLHHVCGVKACVNVAHLELVTPGQHRERHWNCNHGNRYRTSQGYMRCRECDRQRQRRYERRKRARLIDA